ncbi:MAG: hypothetical protein JWO31_889 [Phycisphaerales bacterium]|nr:hypothetical protein [Phycisphaerales bacterium]
MSISAGFSAVAYCLTTGSRATWGTETAGVHVGAAPGSLVEMKCVRDLTIPLEMGEADITTRGDKGNMITLPTLLKCSVDISAIWNTADPVVLALLSAFVQRKTIPIAFLDRPSTEDGATGTWADYVVTKWEKGEALAEGQTAKFTVKPGPSLVPPEVVRVGDDD